jgi:peptidoglycan/xylan/chitin deacetylase (PgdA/CDA1 family)
MRLNQLGEALQSGCIPPGAVVLTLDDGYADNLHHAKPLLERFDVPATVFVTAGCLGQRREFCCDELDRLLLQPGILPATLRLNINGSNHQWDLGEAGRYDEEDFGRYRGWNVLEKNDPGPRQRLYRALWKLLRPLREGEQRQVLDDLLAWSRAESIVRPTHRALSPAELLNLVEGELIEVGAHTVTHPILSQLSATEQRAEIQGGKTRLEAIVGRPVTSFAYPYGGRPEYTAETVAIVRDTGYGVACSTVEDVVWRGSDRFQLPRISVQDLDGEVFSRWLWGWLRG